MNKWQRLLGEHARAKGAVTVPGKALSQLVRYNPRTTWEARHLPGVGRKTALLLVELGLLRDDGYLDTGSKGRHFLAKFKPSASSQRWQRHYLANRAQRRVDAERHQSHQTVAELERTARNLMIIDECSALVRQFTRRCPGVAADFSKLRQKYERKAP